jgi:hypothetical protein
VWTQQARLLASDRAKYDAFGSSVAVDGDTAVIGASRESDSGISENGAAYIFNRTGTAWVEQAKLLAGDKGRIHHFGRSVGIDGDTALIGAMGQTDTGTYRNGTAYVFANMEGKWDEQAKLLASDKATENWFGEAVAIDGQTAVIGARLNSDNGSMSGSAYVFDLSPPIVVINDLMTFQPDPSSYSITPNTAGCPPGYNAKFHFEAQLGNSSQLALSDLYIQVAVLRNDNALLTSAGGAFGAGIVVPVPEADGYADELLAPAEYVDVPFTICLRRMMPFRFMVDVLGQPLTMY